MSTNEGVYVNMEKIFSSRKWSSTMPSSIRKFKPEKKYATTLSVLGLTMIVRSNF